MLTVFMEPRCLGCHQMMEWLDAWGEEYNTIDISADGGAQQFVRMRQGGQLTVPMLWDAKSATSVVGV